MLLKVNKWCQETKCLKCSSPLDIGDQLSEKEEGDDWTVSNMFPKRHAGWCLLILSLHWIRRWSGGRLQDSTWSPLRKENIGTSLLSLSFLSCTTLLERLVENTHRTNVTSKNKPISTQRRNLKKFIECVYETLCSNGQLYQIPSCYSWAIRSQIDGQTDNLRTQCLKLQPLLVQIHTWHSLYIFPWKSDSLVCVLAALTKSYNPY